MPQAYIDSSTGRMLRPKPVREYSTRGGTTGKLISASKYPSERVFQNGDTYEIGYRLSLTV